MQIRPIVALAAGAVLLLVACSSGAPTVAPTTEASVAPSAEASVAPSAEASAEASAAVVCAENAAAGEVAVAIKDFAFIPGEIQAKVGQTLTFTNGDSAPHTATLDDGSCTTPNIGKGRSDGLTFNAAGTYPFHCRIHPDMKGTITVS